MVRKIRFKASGTRKIARTHRRVLESGRSMIKNALDKLIERKYSYKSNITERHNQIKETLGIIAMKKAIARKHVSGM
jgi:hypothetical protein